MPLLDLSLAECRTCRTELTVPDGFGTFRSDTLRDAEKRAGPPVHEPVDTELALIETYDVTVTGHDGESVRGRLHLPAEAQCTGRLLGPVVEFPGYGRGGGLPREKLLRATAGYAHLIMDSRGQNWSASPGATPDPAEHPVRRRPRHPDPRRRGPVHALPPPAADRRRPLPLRGLRPLSGPRGDPGPRVQRP